MEHDPWPAGTRGVGVPSIGAGLPGEPEALASQWKIAEDTAAKHGETVSREKWPVVVNAHIAEGDEQALNEVRKGEPNETFTHFEDTLGPPPGRSIERWGEDGATLAGLRETVTKENQRLLKSGSITHSIARPDFPFG